MKKLLICPYFGQLPTWFDKFYANYEETLKPKGYDLLLTTNLDLFKKRVKEKLGIECPIVYGTGKIWDYRCAFGVLFEEELKGYDYYGHCDFDMMFGDVSKWFPDEEIEKLDIWSNHNTYICGPWTLYKNTKEVNELFMKCENWREIMESPTPTGWVEQEYSRKVEDSGLNYRYSFYQGNPYTSEPNLFYKDGKLYQDREEIAMFHFKRSKKWSI